MPKFSMNQSFKCGTGRSKKIAGFTLLAPRTKLGPRYAGVKVDKFKSAELEKPEILLYM